MPRIIEVAISPSPPLGAILARRGSTNDIPKKPYTTDGMPASRFIAAHKNFLILFGQ